MILLSQGITLINATLVLFQPVQFPRLGYICLPLGGGHYIGKEALEMVGWVGGECEFGVSKHCLVSTPPPPSPPTALHLPHEPGHQP